MEEISYSGSRAGGIKKRKRLFVFGGLFLIILLLLGSAIYFITSGNSSEPDQTDEISESIDLPEETTEEITESPTPTEEPSVTPVKSTAPSKTPTKAASANTANSDIAIVVQNGSGEAGVAGAGADVLKAAGYTISSTGNADNFDYTDVTIKIKNSEKGNLSDIEDALSADYTVGETSTDLPEATAYDVLVIIGK